MNVVELIERKRDGGAWRDDEIRWFIENYTAGHVPDYQAAAWAMAVYFQGMTREETVALTQTMAASGRILSWPDHLRPLVDKHSTGGVGDKVSLILAPWLACCGVRVPMISGRALGPTGGTLDKLESIPGLRTDLSIDEFAQVVADVGCAISGATREIVPADKKLYALRDVTATVPSIPLITASILSKKLAEGLDVLVLDVKYGRGAFMKNRQQAEQLARSLEAIAAELGLRAKAVLHPMDQPLGRKVGNSLEVQEAVEVLRGKSVPDLLSVTRRLGCEALQLAGVAEGEPHAQQLLDTALRSGAAWERFCAMVRAQGGDPEAPLAVAHAYAWKAPRSGILLSIDAHHIGYAVVELGGGRLRQEDAVDHRVGLEFLATAGEEVHAGDDLVLVYAADEAGFQRAAQRLQQAIVIQ
ncbi:MAG: thymidine phosphorylase [Pirellulaceae bacterium]|nr:MAG: thymidine phosphorylase [Pirellulaceae bacterium]